jgi:hypothetical protein
MSNRFSEPKTEEEAQRQQKVLREGAQTDVKRLDGFEGGAAAATLDQPGTMKFNTTVEALVREIRAGAGRRALLRLEFAEVQGPGQFFGTIHMNRPDASIKTPPDDPSLVGTFSFFPHDRDHPTTNAGDIPRHEFDITRFLEKLPLPASPITVTLVLAPLVKDVKPSLRVRAASLFIVESIVRRAS